MGSVAEMGSKHKPGFNKGFRKWYWSSWEMQRGALGPSGSRRGLSGVSKLEVRLMWHRTAHARADELDILGSMLLFPSPSFETQRNGLVFIYDMAGSQYTNFELDLSKKILNLLKVTAKGDLVSGASR